MEDLKKKRDELKSVRARRDKKLEEFRAIKKELRILEVELEKRQTELAELVEAL